MFLVDICYYCVRFIVLIIIQYGAVVDSVDGGHVSGDVIQWRRQVATKRLRRLLQLDPDNERALFNLGMLAMDDGDMASAEHHFKVQHFSYHTKVFRNIFSFFSLLFFFPQASVLLKANFRSALFNLALLLSDTGRPLEAVPFLKQLVHHHTDHIKGLILLGDIYINSLADLDAAEAVRFYIDFFVVVMQYLGRKNVFLSLFCIYGINI